MPLSPLPRDVTVAWTRDLSRLGGTRVERIEHRDGLTLSDAVLAVPEDVRSSVSDPLVTVNGQPFGRDLWSMPLFMGDHVSWRPRMQDPASIVTLVAVSLITTAIATGVQLLLAPTPPRRQRGDESSPTASWRGLRMSFGAGQPIPNGFGLHAVAGQVIQSFRRATALASSTQPLSVGEDTLFLLVSFGYGPHYDIGGYRPPLGEDQFDDEDASVFPDGGVTIEDQPLTVDLYPNARFWWRNGQEQQPAIPGFSNLRTEYPVGIEFRVPPTPKQTVLVASPLFVDVRAFVYVASTVGFYAQDSCILDPGGANQTTRVIDHVSEESDVTAITQTTTPSGQPTLVVDTLVGFQVGEVVEINPGMANAETKVIQAINPSPPFPSNTVNFLSNLAAIHNPGEPVIRRKQFAVGGNQITGIPANAIVQRIGRPGQRSVVYRTTAESSQLSNQSVDPGIVVRVSLDSCYEVQGGNAQAFLVQFQVSERLEGDVAWSNTQTFALNDKKTEPFSVDLRFRPTARALGRKLEVLIERTTLVDGVVGSRPGAASNAEVESVLESIVSTYTTLQGGSPVTRTDEHRYPFHALVGMQLPAVESFSGSRSPTIKWRSRLTWCADVTSGGGGYSFVAWQQIPSAIDRWTRNPSRVAMEILTNELWGMGDTYTPANLNLEEFYRWKVYCDQSVSDGQGGTKPRFQFDVNWDEVQTRDDALLAVGAIGRAVFVDVNGLITPIFAHPDDPGAGLPLPITGLYTEAVIIGGIKREYLPVNNLPDVINVEFLNAERNYDRDVQPVRDPKARRKPYRLRGTSNKPETLNLPGCTSVAQAVSEGRYRHNVLRLIGHRYEFIVPREAMQSTPGDRIAAVHSAFRWFGAGTITTTVARDSGPSYPPDDVLRVADASNFAAEDRVQVNPAGGGSPEIYTVASVDIDAAEITLTSSLTADHTAASAHKVVNLGLGANGSISADSGAGQPDPSILNTSSISGIRQGDELWINPGGSREERHWVEEVISDTQFRLRNLMTFTHTVAQGDLVRCLSFSTYTGRTIAAGTATDSVAIDQDVEVPSTPGFVAIAVRQRDGTVKQARVTDAAGSYAAGHVFTAPGLGSTHGADAPVALGIETRMLQEMRLAEVRKNEDDTYTLIAVDYDPEVFDDSPDNVVEPSADAGSAGFGIPSLAGPSAVSAVLAVQSPIAVVDGTGSVDVRWSKAAEQASGSVSVWYREVGSQDATWRRAGSTRTGQLRIADLDAGRTYEVAAVPETGDRTGFVEPAAGLTTTVTLLERGVRRIGGV